MGWWVFSRLGGAVEETHAQHHLPSAPAPLCPVLPPIRRLSHAKVQREKRRAATEAAAAEKQGGGGGWIEWLRGGGSASKPTSPRPTVRCTAAAAAAKLNTPATLCLPACLWLRRHPSAAVQGQEAAPELTSEEYGRLVELVEQQEQGLR